MSTTTVASMVGNNQLKCLANSSPDGSNGPSIELEQSSEYEGNQIYKKRPDQIRIGYININGIPKTTKDPKNINLG